MQGRKPEKYEHPKDRPKPSPNPKSIFRGTRAKVFVDGVEIPVLNIDIVFERGIFKIPEEQRGEVMWRRKLPIEDGFFWFKGTIKGKPKEIWLTIVRVDTDYEDEPRIRFIGSTFSFPFSALDGFFSGPLKPPE